MLPLLYFLPLSLSSVLASQSINAIQSVLDPKPSSDCTCNTALTGPIETTECDYEALDGVNNDLYEHLSELVETPFFRYFRVDLYRECPFWAENGFCMNRECGITTVDESEIPQRWRAEALSKVELPSQQQRNSMPGCYYRDSDFCFLDDMTEGDYVDLVVNPERFTGYVGEAAHRVWRAIYQENCFGLSEASWASEQSAVPVSIPNTLGKSTSDFEPMCLEKRIYYKVISGLHASITTHICREDFNQITGEWSPNLECFKRRVASNPERLQYMYFNTVLLLRAVSRLGPYLSAYDYCSSGSHEEDAFTWEKLHNVIDIAHKVGKFDESALFRGENANVLKEEFKDHFRNVTRIMDCVGCDKCRLWGKVQTTGIATALKVLFELDEKALDPTSNSNLLSRSEVVALINTLHRFSESLNAVGDFRKMWAAIKVSEKTAPRSLPSQPVGAPEDKIRTPAYVLREWKEQVLCLLRLCQSGTKNCVSAVVSVLRGWVSILASLFKTSGKDKGPHSEL